jgi:predicted nucleic-acid-binding protein
MTALDTNVLVRVIARDDEAQRLRAEEVLASGPCFVPDTVLLELTWVLESVYGATSERIVAELEALLGVPTLFVASEARVRRALDGVAAGLDVADAFHRAASEDADRFVTFDRRFVRAAAGTAGVSVEAL